MIKLNKRGVQISLGLLWLLDGLLQLQPKMFTDTFAHRVIAPAAQGQPAIIGSPMHLGINVILTHPAIFDACFAVIQLGIGAAILWKRTTRYGLYGSVVWGLAVWFGGEGLAGIASGHAAILMGAPGAALIYVILSLAVMPSGAREDKHPAYWLVLVWAILWIGGAAFQIMPGQNSVKDVSGMISGMANGAPGWLASLDNHTANVINRFGSSEKVINSSRLTQVPQASMPGMSMSEVSTTTQSNTGYWFILLLVLAQLFVGIGVLFAGYWRRIAIASGILLSLIFWILGQGMGSYYTGLATDPNSGPLFVLLGMAILGCVDLDKKLSMLNKRIKYAVIGGPN